MKKSYWIFVIIVLAILGLLAARFLIGGSEDTWICEGGKWVKHGNPASPSPSAVCRGSTSKE